MALPPLQYTVSLSSSAAHTFNVELFISSPDVAGQKLTLPAWIPGSYMIRDFARNIVTIRAYDENDVAVELTRLDKQSFQAPAGLKGLKIVYTLYAFDRSIRSAYLDDEYGFFNGTSLFLRVVGQEHKRHSLTLNKPETFPTWRATTAMPVNDVNTEGFGTYQAESYDVFVDHPVLIGEFDRYPFRAAGVDFELILVGGHQADTKRICHDLSMICEHHIGLFNDIPPVEKYLFITMLTADGFGGLEHLDSTALMYSRDDLPRLDQADEMPDGYRTFLSLCSHEFFHTWHVKRIRPAELAIANLTNEQYTEQLWIYEGFTSYYDDISLRWTELIDQDSYLELMGQNLTRLLRNKGRHFQSVTESSFYAWNKFYKQDASAINTIVSYYNKGAVIAMCLDLYIRQQSNQSSSLNDVMRTLWKDHGKPDIGTAPDVIHRIMADSLKIELPHFLHDALYGTNELPAEQLLKAFGVAVNRRARINNKDKGGKPAEHEPTVAFGAVYSANSIGVKVMQVIDQTPAHQAGIQIGDILISVDNWQVSEGDLQQRLENARAAAFVTLHFIRDKRLKTAQLVIEPAPQDTVYLTVEDASLANHWLSAGS